LALGEFVPKLYEQYQFNVEEGPWFKDAVGLPNSFVDKAPIRFIAYYLPQFHPIRENDEWWGTGFTDWNNVAKALPRYVGHQQPRLPMDLGFYDLRQADALRQQAGLAKRAGIYGFCIHDYWFSGHKVLETPLRILLDNPDIDLRFCLNWANESWSRTWDGKESNVLLRQKYAAGDDEAYARSILEAVKDPRYIRIGNRPLVMFYRPSFAPDGNATVAAWRKVFKAEGVGDPYVVMAQTFDEDPGKYGMDAAAGFPPHGGGWDLPNDRDWTELLDPRFSGNVVSFEALARTMLANIPKDYLLLPGVCPGWDNEARRTGRGFSFYGATPAAYGAWLKAASRQIMQSTAKADERIVFINAWNEWAEGAYLEPDRHSGFAYLIETRRVAEDLGGSDPGPMAEVESKMAASPWAAPRLSERNHLANRLRSKWRGTMAKLQNR
jgi:lipopolysaccharide biosynthesis protein